MRLPDPELQIGFGLRLRGSAREHLQASVLKTVQLIDVRDIDASLARFAPQAGLKLLAAQGLRGELAFATPAMLRANPRLLGYYRLLLGYSQKDFYGKRIGAGRFKALEINGILSSKAETDLDELCTALCDAANTLLSGLYNVGLSQAFLSDLSLLTLGAQFRGTRNNDIGASGVSEVVKIIERITSGANPVINTNIMSFTNAAGRKVKIEFGADPDVTVRVALHDGEIDQALAIEIKAGSDFSNLYNRLGEAEKSHLTAYRHGFTDFWTIVNTPQFDKEKAEQKSPTTNRFYRLEELLNENSSSFLDFRSRILAKVGLPEEY